MDPVHRAPEPARHRAPARAALSLPTAALLLLLSLSLSACSNLLTHLAVPMSPDVGRGPGGVLAESDPTGPDFWLGDGASMRLLSTDATGDRALITDGHRLAIWDGRRARLEQLLPVSGRAVQRAVLSRGGAHILAIEHESSRSPQLEWLRVIDVDRGRTLLTLPMPCGCIIDVAFGERSGTVRALVSSPSLGGTYILSWSMEGEFIEQVQVTDTVIDRWQGSPTFFDEGEQAMLFLRDDGDVDTAFLVALGERSSVRRLQLDSPFDDGPCDGPSWRCGRIATVTPDAQGLLLATGSAELTTWLERRDLRTGALVWGRDVPAINPVLWTPWDGDAVQLVAHGVSDEGFSSGMAGHVVDTARGDVTSEARWDQTPVPAMLRVVPWAEADTMAAFRTALQLPEGINERGWTGNAPQLFVDRDTGVRHVVTLNAYFRLDDRPARMPTLTASAPLSVFEGRWNMEVPHLRGVATAFGLSLEVIRNADAYASSLAGPSEYYRWNVPAGLLVDAQRLPSGDIVVQSDSAGATERLFVIRPPVTPTDGWVAMRSMPAAPGVERYVMATSPDGALVTLAGLIPHADDQPTTLDLTTWDTERLSPHDHRTLDLPPNVTRLVAVPGLDHLAAYTRHAVHLVAIDTGAVRSWSPRPGDWVKGALPVGADRVAVRLAHHERPSGEWWLTLDLATSPPRILGERRFADVMAWAVWPEGQTLDVLERRGVLTRMSVADGLAIVDRTLLSSAASTFLTLDHAGRLRLPDDAAGFAEALAWLREGWVMPVVLDATGRVQLNSGHLIRRGPEAPRW